MIEDGKDLSSGSGSIVGIAKGHKGSRVILFVVVSFGTKQDFLRLIFFAKKYRRFKCIFFFRFHGGASALAQRDALHQVFFFLFFMRGVTAFWTEYIVFIPTHGRS